MGRACSAWRLRLAVAKEVVSVEHLCGQGRCFALYDRSENRQSLPSSRLRN